MREEDIFHEALARRIPEERAAYLDKACAGQPGLRAALEALLRAAAQGSDFLHPAPRPRAETSDDRPPAAIAPPGPELTGPFVKSSADGPGSALSDLRRILGALRPVLLHDAEGEGAHVVRLQSDAMPLPEQAGDRYQLSGEIARGGMGAVLRGRDVDLGRDLAVKVLLEKYADRPEVARRFIEEAQIGGQLQHPGVVPVYDIGRFGERPFFTMKLVKGQTLAALLGGRADPSADRPRFLTIALQVAQTLAYAHAKGVIHRDLKPANIMVGAFGEVQVMDWGLAKVLAEGGVTDEEKASRQHQPTDGTQIRTARRGGSAGSVGTDTQAGTLLGTPAYMAPEQANGNVAQLDRRADVFGLGAILCEILTGKPPFVGRSFEEVRRKACNCDLAEAVARLEGCGADQELIVLTKACLAAEASDRPQDAQAVAARLTAYLDGVQERLRQAELAEAEARAKALEERKRRRVQLALAGALSLLVLGGSAGGWLWQQQRQAAAEASARRLREADTSVTLLLSEARLLLAQAQSAPLSDLGRLREARLAARKAEELARTNEVSEDVSRQAAELAQALEAELTAAGRDVRLLAALLEVRGPREGPRLQEDAKGRITMLVQPSADEQFQAAFREWGLDVDALPTAEAAARLKVRPAGVVTEVVAALDEWASERRVPGRPAAEWQRLALLAQTLDEGGDARRRELRQMLARGRLARERGLAALSAALRPVPVPFAWSWGEDQGRLRQLAAATDPAVEPVLGLLTLVRALRVAGDDRAAEDLLREASQARPREVVLHNALGQLLEEQQRWREAVECYGPARALRPEFGDALANALVHGGRVSEGLALYKRLIAERRDNPWPHFRHSYALLEQRKYKEAEAACREAIKHHPKFADAHNHLGVALDHIGQVDEAIASYQKAVELYPKHAVAHYNLGIVLADKGEVAGAIASFRKAVELTPKHGNAHTGLGDAHRRKGQLDDAMACFRKAIEVEPNYTDAHINLGALLCDFKRDFDGAIACFKNAIELDSMNAQVHFNLGAALSNKGQMDQAIACWREAIRIDPKLAAAHFNLGQALTGKGNALAGKGLVDEAIACWREAIELDPNLATAHYNLGIVLAGKGEVAGAIASFRKAVELTPKHGNAHTGLGIALQSNGLVDKAIACYRKAIEVEPNYSLAHYSLGNALRGKGQLDDAIASYQKAIALNPKEASAHVALCEAFFDKGRYAEARDASRRALELLAEENPLRAFASRQVQVCEHFLKLEERLPRLLRGADKPVSAAESLDLATLCRRKQMYAAAARFAADAYVAEPKRAGDLSGQRYNAACFAALAAAGQGADAARFDDKERTRLRHQALGWLRAELAAWRTVLDRGPPAARPVVCQTLQHWQQNADLAGLRDPAALAKLPAEQRAACTQLWADVAALLKKAQENAK
jgi:tetratricopeptide (TPR) repeat protein